MVILIQPYVLKFGARLFLDQLRTGLSDLLLNLSLLGFQRGQRGLCDRDLGFDSNQVECA
jgi:hypothetical protein